MKARILGLWIASMMVACSSAPEIPDQPDEKVEYRSTQQEEETETKPAAVEQAAPSVVKAVGPVATVNGKPIPASEFNIEIERVTKTGVAPMLVNRFKDTIVQRLVDRYLIEGAVEAQKVVVTDKEVDEKLDEVRKEFAKATAQAGKDATLEELVKQLGITTDELRKSVKQSVAIEKMLISRGLKTPAEAEAKKFYDEQPDQFQAPEQVHVRHVLIAVPRGSEESVWEEAKGRAQAIYVEATKPGADFEALAREKSDGPSAANSGDLGFVPRGKTMPEFEGAAFGLKDGEISEPVRSPFGWHIIKREGYKPGGKIEFKDVKEKLITQLKAQTTKIALEGYLEELRKSATIEIHSENLQ